MRSGLVNLRRGYMTLVGMWGYYKTGMTADSQQAYSLAMELDVSPSTTTNMYNGLSARCLASGA